MFGDIALATFEGGLVVIVASNSMTRNTALIIGVKGPMARGSITEGTILLTSVGGLVTGDTTLKVNVGSPIAGATTLTANSSDPVTRPLAPTTSVLSHRFWWFV